MSQNKIRCRAAVCWGLNQPMVIEDVDVLPPGPGEVRYKVLYSGICHSDLSGQTGIFSEDVGPIVLGHEAIGVVESVGQGVKDFKPGDQVIPLFNPNCTRCLYCKDGRTNFCQKLVTMPLGNQRMDDGTTRFALAKDGTPINHFVNCSTFAQYSVSSDAALARVNVPAVSDLICLFGCCMPTGYGAARKTAGVVKGSTCAVWGLGAVGLCAVLGCADAGAVRVVAVDINAAKKDVAMKMGATDFINPQDYPDNREFVNALLEMTGGLGFDYTFECIGNVQCIETALEVCKRGVGKSVVVGIPHFSKKVSTSPLSLIQGRTWTGSFCGSYKPKEDFPKLVNSLASDNAGRKKLENLVTHRLPLDKIDEGFQLLAQGKSIRTVINMWE